MRFKNLKQLYEFVEGALKGIEQSPKYHSEGDAWTHTKLVFEKMEEFVVTHETAALLHDIGKAKATTKDSNGKIQSLKHTKYSVDFIDDNEFLFLSGKQLSLVRMMVEQHMNGIQMHTNSKSMKKLVREIGISPAKDLMILVMADVRSSLGENGKPYTNPSDIRESFETAIKSVEVDNDIKKALKGFPLNGKSFGNKLQGKEIGIGIKAAQKAYIAGERDESNLIKIGLKTGGF